MEVPQVQYTDRMINVPVLMQRTVLTVRATQKTVEVPQIQHVPVVSQGQAQRPEVPHSQYLDQVKDVPVETSQSPFTDRCVDVPVQR